MSDELGINNPCQKCGRIVRIVIVKKTERGASTVRRCLGCNRREDRCLCPRLPDKLEMGKPPLHAKVIEPYRPA